MLSKKINLRLNHLKTEEDMNFKKLKKNPFGKITVEEVIANLIEEENDDLSDSDVSTSDTEENEILFFVNNDSEDESKSEDEIDSD